MSIGNENLFKSRKESLDERAFLRSILVAKPKSRERHADARSDPDLGFCNIVEVY